MLLTITADRSPTTTDLGFTASLGLRADIARSRDMRTAWDDMAAAALDFDTDRYEQAKARFNAVRDVRQQRAIETMIASDGQERLFVRHPVNGCLLAKED